MKLALVKGTTNTSVYIFIQDSSSTTGAGLTGLVYNSAGLTCYYIRPLAAAAVLTLATQTVTGAHSDGGLVEVSAANAPGWYRLDLSDAILASGVDSVGVHLKGAANMAPLPLEIQLTSVDLNDAVRGGMTALPSAAADAAGGLAISDAGGLDMDALNTAAIRLTAARAQVLDDWINTGRLDAILDARMAETSISTTAGAVDTVTTLTNKTGFSLAATGLDLIASTATGFVQIAKAVWDRIVSKANHNIGQSAGKVLRQGSDLVQIDGSISDVAPSVTDFDTDLTQADGFFDDAVMIFSNGSANAGIGRPIVTYLNANGNMAFISPDDWPVTPVDGDEFVIFANHVHPVSQIQSGLATEAKQDIIDANVDLVLADTADMQPKLGTPAADLAADVAAVKVDTAAILIDTASPKINTAFPNLPVFMVNSTDNVTPETGLTLSVTRSIDGGAFGAATGSAAEIGNGAYQFDASAADMNGAVIIFRFTSAGAADSLVTVHTRP